MDSSSIELPGSEVESIQLEKDTLRVRFSRAYIIKTMTGSTERTRWWQAGDLVLFDTGDGIVSPTPERPSAGCVGPTRTAGRPRRSSNGNRSKSRITSRAATAITGLTRPAWNRAVIPFADPQAERRQS